MEFTSYPNPDKPEQIATKAPRHKAKRVTFWLIFIFASLCLGGVNVLPRTTYNKQRTIERFFAQLGL